MKKPKTTKHKVHRLGWNGMQEIEIKLKDFPEALQVDDWFAPQKSELCLNPEGKVDVVKDITWKNAGIHTKGGRVYSFENSKTTIVGCTERVFVKPDHVFILNGRPFVYQEPLDGGYLDKMARGEEITEYEYREFDKPDK